MKDIVDNKFHTGAIEAPVSYKDYSFELAAASLEPVDWRTGYDVRNEIGAHIPSKNQFNSLSCVGQSWSYYIWVLNLIELGLTNKEIQNHFKNDMVEVSAKAIYSQIYLLSGGAYIVDGAKLAINWGSVKEDVVPSLKQDKTVDEHFMRDETWRTPRIDELARILRGKNYRTIRSRQSIELMAQAIKNNYGVVSGFYGENNGTWHTQRPSSPLNKKDWAHCVYYGAFGQDEYGRFIATPNSWGLWFEDREWQSGDPPGFGWQKIYADYFIDNLHFNAWTLMDRQNITTNDMLKLIKTKDSDRIYALSKNNVAKHIYSEHAFETGRDMGIWGDWGEVQVVDKSYLQNLTILNTPFI